MDEQKEKKKKRRTYRRLEELFTEDKQKITRLLKRVVIKGYGKVDLIDEYYRMQDWAENNNARASVARFSKWVERAMEWKEARIRKNYDPDEEQQDKITKALNDEKKRSEARLREFRRERPVPSKKHRARRGTDTPPDAES